MFSASGIFSDTSCSHGNAKNSTFGQRKRYTFPALHVSTWPHEQEEHIGAKIFGVRVVVREIWILFVLLGEALFHRDFGSLHQNLYHSYSGHISVMTPSYSTPDALTWSHEQGEEVNATCFVLRGVVWNACQSTRKIHRAFGNPRE